MTMRISRLCRVLAPGAALIALAALSSAATAQVTAEQQSAIRSNCRSDFMSKCSGVTPGGKDALNCLQKNVASLSPACKTAVSATIPAPAPAEAKPAQAAPAPAPAAATAAPAAAPPAPVRPVITAVPPPPAVKPQQAQKPAAPPKQPVAAPPKQAIVAPPAAAAAPANEAAPTPTPQQLSAIKFTCRRDFATYCRGVPAGGAEAFACLQRNTAKLLPDCKTSLADIGDAAPAAAPGAVAPPSTRTPNAPVVMTAVIGRACLRDLLLHCRDIKVGDGQKIACLMERGPKLAVLCKAALKITESVR